MGFKLKDTKYKVYCMHVKSKDKARFNSIFKTTIAKRRLCELNYGSLSTLLESLDFGDVIFCRYNTNVVEDTTKYVEAKIRFFDNDKDICWFIYEDDILISSDE